MLQNVRAKNAVRLRVRNELDHSIKLFVRDRAPIRPKRKLAEAIIDPLLFRLLFGQTNAGQFRIRVNNSGDRIIINVAVSARDAFYASDPFVLRFVRQHWTGDHVADRVNSIDLRLEMLVDFDSLLFVELNADFLSAKTLAERFASD